MILRKFQNEGSSRGHYVWDSRDVCRDEIVCSVDNNSKNVVMPPITLSSVKKSKASATSTCIVGKHVEKKSSAFLNAIPS